MIFKHRDAFKIQNMIAKMPMIAFCVYDRVSHIWIEKSVGNRPGDQHVVLDLLLLGKSLDFVHGCS